MRCPAIQFWMASGGRTALRLLLVITFLALSPSASSGEDPSDPAPLLTLDRAIQLALANNRTLRIASLDVDKSNWQVAEAKTRRLPSFKTFMFASGNITSPVFTFQAGTFGTVLGVPVPSKTTEISLSQGVTGYALVTASQPISQLYKIHLAIEEQVLASQLASVQYRGKCQSVVASVKQAYYAVLQTESSLEATRALVAQYEETNRVTLQYVAQETVLKSDSLQVKAKLAQAEYQIVELRNGLQTQKEQLNNLLGRDLETGFRTQQVPPPAAVETNLPLAQQTALAQRPEIKQAEIGVKKANVDRKLAKAQYIPDIGAAFQYFTPINTQILPQNIASAGIEFSWEPFEWGRRKDEVNQKNVVLAQSQYQLKETQAEVLLDVNNRFRQLDQSRVALVVAQVGRDAANEKLREVSDKFHQTAVLLRDVLEQQANVANANHDYQQALLAFWTAKANFEKALGEE